MAPPRTRGNKVNKPAAKNRRDSRRSSVSKTATPEPTNAVSNLGQTEMPKNPSKGLSQAIQRGLQQASALSKSMAYNRSIGSHASMKDQQSTRSSVPGSVNSSFGYSSDASSVVQQSLSMDASQSQQSLALSQASSSFEVAQVPTAPPSTPVILDSSSQQLPQQGVQLRTAQELASKWFSKEIALDSTMCQRLGDELAKREPVQRKLHQELNLTRRSNVEALLSQITGEEATNPCKNCHKGHGPWKTCVVKEGQLCGSCANCWFNASGSRCTFHGQYEKARSVFRYLKNMAKAKTTTTAKKANDGPESNMQQAYTPHGPLQPAASILQLAAAAQLPTTGTQPANALLQVAQVPQQQPDMSPQVPAVLAGLGLWHSTHQTNQMVNDTICNITALDKQSRYLFRIQAAAKELGIRIAEYDDFLDSQDRTFEEVDTTAPPQSQNDSDESPSFETSPSTAEAPEAIMG
ncbi:hypothetical protein ACO1O0_008203 [Amphichorda felina]